MQRQTVSGQLQWDAIRQLLRIDTDGAWQHESAPPPLLRLAFGKAEADL